MSHIYHHLDTWSPLPSNPTLPARHGRHHWCPLYTAASSAASSLSFSPSESYVDSQRTLTSPPVLERRRPIQLPPVSEPDDEPLPACSNVKNSYDVHPFLARPALPIIYDIRHPPSTIRFPRSSPYCHHSFSDLTAPLISPGSRQVRIISKQFPWTIDIDYTKQEEGKTVTCLDVLTALHCTLQETLADYEWALADWWRKEKMERARGRRIRIEKKQTVLKRVDWLGSHSLFLGLEKHERFVKGRLYPGILEVSETWVVEFGRVNTFNIE